MKRFLLTAVFVLIGSLAYTQERIAVFPFEDRNNVYTKDELDSFYVEFNNEFRNRTDDRRFTVIPRQDVEKLIDMEAKFQLSDYSSKEKTAEMYRVLNAKQILYGLILKVDNNIRITVSRYTFPELEVLRGGITVIVTNKNQLFSKIPELVQSMQAAINVEGRTGDIVQTYKIGDTGPAGGIIFLDKGGYSNGWRYLEVAPVEAEIRSNLGGATEEAYVGGIRSKDGLGTHSIITGKGIGNGKYNTESILSHFELNNMLSDGVLHYCKHFKFGGYNDWFLPSYDELDLVYHNLNSIGIGGFSKNFYWSSSQGWNENLFYILNFADGELNFCNGNDSFLIGPGVHVQVLARFIRQF